MTSMAARLRRVWPTTLTGQMVLWVVLALVLAMLVNIWVLSRAHRHTLAVTSERFAARQFASQVIVLENTPQELHSRVIKAWRRPNQISGFSDLAQAADADSDAERRIERVLLQHLGDDYRGRLKVALTVATDGEELAGDDRRGPGPGGPGGDRDWRPPHPDPAARGDGPRRFSRDWRERRGPPLEQLLLAARLEDGRWFHSRLTAPPRSPLAAVPTLTFLVIAGVLVLLVLVWQLRRITRPLRDLERAAGELGRGQPVAPLPLRGPQDIRSTLDAFNTMNERLQRFVSERTRMLAALSHDLRTPLTSMRLRLELMPEGELRDKLIASLEEMQQMAEATLAFVRDAGDREEWQRVALEALLGSLCDDFTELGHEVTLEEGDPQAFMCRPISLTRALRNLLENAVRYAGGAEVRLGREGDELVVRIRDRGPGIPADQLEHVFDPFFRLEGSRSRDTGGMGLGLSIARQIIHAHGGRIQLANCQPGLEVTVRLPG